PRSTLFPYTTLFRSSLKISLQIMIAGALSDDEAPAEKCLRAACHKNSASQSKCISHFAVNAEGAAFLRDDRDAQDQHRYLMHLRSEEHTSELQSREN